MKSWSCEAYNGQQCSTFAQGSHVFDDDHSKNCDVRLEVMRPPSCRMTSGRSSGQRASLSSSRRSRWLMSATPCWRAAPMESPAPGNTSLILRSAVPFHQFQDKFLLDILTTEDCFLGPSRNAKCRYSVIWSKGPLQDRFSVSLLLPSEFWVN